ncbi:MAG: adenosylcobinamide-phosphate guanylyltransferase [Polaromonas sp. 28-63-22]|nr:MAG: adenosylcobinamide-phosphate guanylyltransferase [Polaromonas sp. 28-63-22]
MPERPGVVRTELILGGQRSGKSRRAEALAQRWLAESPRHRAVLIATAQPWDDEMRERIARHQQDRAARVPGMLAVEEPLALGTALAQHSDTQTLVVVDCLTLWLTNCLMPYESAEKQPAHAENGLDYESNRAVAHELPAQAAMLLIVIKKAAGPVVLVGNEIGLGVIPMGRETRAFVDALGRLNQDVAAVCERVTFMAAGVADRKRLRDGAVPASGRR